MRFFGLVPDGGRLLRQAFRRFFWLRFLSCAVLLVTVGINDMKNTFNSISISLFLLFFSVLPCAAAHKDKRTIKPSLDAVGTFHRAYTVAENYDLKVFVENKEWGKTDFVAYNKKSGEGVAYFYKYIKSAERIVEFCYYNLAGESESEIRIYENDDLLALKNSFPVVDFTSSTHYMPFDLYRLYTEHLVMQREIIKTDYTKKYGIKFVEEMNPEQPQVRVDKAGRIFLK